MEFINKAELLEALEKRFGDLSDNMGCYGKNGWFSNAAVLEVIESLPTY